MSEDGDARDPHIRLRAWAPADGHWYIAQLRDPEIQRFTTERADTTVNEFRAALEQLNRNDNIVGFAITDAATGELAGNLAAHRQDDTAEIHYWIAPGWRRRGFASEAVTQIVEWIAANWPGCDLVLEIDAANIASQRVAQKLGFECQQNQHSTDETRQHTVRWYHTKNSLGD
ncbi:MAG: GNAT family N-acetyltransferase [Actinobacteria bacterium]|nr:GNAT family N-acetyltransferase [Actinomycetota bacterium]